MTDADWWQCTHPKLVREQSFLLPVDLNFTFCTNRNSYSKASYRGTI